MPSIKRERSEHSESQQLDISAALREGEVQAPEPAAGGRVPGPGRWSPRFQPGWGASSEPWTTRYILHGRHITWIWCAGCPVWPCLGFAERARLSSCPASSSHFPSISPKNLTSPPHTYSGLAPEMSTRAWAGAWLGDVLWHRAAG